MLTSFLNLLLLASLDGSAIPKAMHGIWAPVASGCADPVNRLAITAQSLEWYEAEGFLVLGVDFSGTRSGTTQEVLGFEGRFAGKDIDSDQKFWDAELTLALTGATLTIERKVESSKDVNVAYKRCLAGLTK